MADFASTIKKHSKKNLTEEDQKKVTTPIKGDVSEEHKNFLVTLEKLLDKGEINPADPKSFLKQDVYDNLDEEWQDKVDLSLANIANQIRLIQDTRAVEGKSIHLQSMVEQLWEMKQRIEEHYDAFKF